MGGTRQAMTLGADFNSASSEIKALGAFFCNGATARNFVVLAARQPESRAVSRAPVHHMLWVRGFRDHTISRPGFNLFKPLPRHFPATPFCRQPLARDPVGLRRDGGARPKWMWKFQIAFHNALCPWDNIV
jgi:hypothetical protein